MNNLVASSLFVVVLIFLTIIAHRLVSKKVDNVTQLHVCRCLYPCGSTGSMLVRIMFLSLLPGVIYNLAGVFELNYLSISSCIALLYVIIQTYTALVCKHIGGQDARQKFYEEFAPRRLILLWSVVLIVLDAITAPIYQQALGYDTKLIAIPIVVITAVGRIILWIIFGGPKRLLKKFLNKINGWSQRLKLRFAISKPKALPAKSAF